MVRVELYDEREFERWLDALGTIERGRAVGKLRVAASRGGSKAGMPLVRSLSGGLFEVRVARLRIYFADSAGDMLVLVLTAGNKDTQTRDIARARRRIP